MATVPEELDGEIASTGLCVLRASQGGRVAPGYLWQIVREDGFSRHLIEKETGSNYPAVRAADVADYRFHLPPVEEQRRIVDLMSHVDEAIHRLGLEVRVIQRTARSARDHIFRELSRERELVPAEAVFGMLLGRQKSARQSVGDHVIPYIRSGNIADGFLRLDDVQTMNFDLSEQEKYGLLAGDVLLAEGGTVGQSAVWESEVQGTVGFDKHVIRLRPLPEISSTNYIHQWCRWAFETGVFQETAKGVTISALGFGRAKALLVPNLEYTEQEETVRPLVAADILERQLIKELEATKDLRTSLLTSLLSGEHVFPASYDDLLRDEGAA